MTRTITLQVNGNDVESTIDDPRLLLSDYLRHELGLTGTHVGCEQGVCGCCTVILDGVAVRSCLLLAIQAHDCDVLTIEGLAQDDELHPVQEAFREAHALQCGFCTPGFVLAIYAYLNEQSAPDLTDSAIREAISGNLCRCTGYQNIVQAVRLAASRLTTKA